MVITAFLSCFPGLLNRGPSLSGCWFSLPHLISNWLNFLCTKVYKSSTPTFFLWASQIALIQPVHGQSYILIFLDRGHLLFTQVHFFLTARPGRRSINNISSSAWTLTKRLEKKLDGNYTRMLRAILNKSWRQHPTRHQLYGHLPPITKTIQVRRTRHAVHCWRSRDELISDVLLWTPTHGREKAGRPAWTYIQQLCEDTGCCPKDLPEAMNDREKWR